MREGTRQLLANLQSAIEQVAANDIAQGVAQPGVELRVSPGPHPEESTLLLGGPATRAAGWPQAREVINAKARGLQPLPAHTPTAQLRAVIERGRDELLAMVNTLTPNAAL